MDVRKKDDFPIHKIPLERFVVKIKYLSSLGYRQYIVYGVIIQ